MRDVKKMIGSGECEVRSPWHVSSNRPSVVASYVATLASKARKHESEESSGEAVDAEVAPAESWRYHLPRIFSDSTTAPTPLRMSPRFSQIDLAISS
ncbi:hypothetical protein V2G26_014953 [Clonostachys chloroleuca]